MRLVAAREQIFKWLTKSISNSKVKAHKVFFSACFQKILSAPEFANSNPNVCNVFSNYFWRQLKPSQKYIWKQRHSSFLFRVRTFFTFSGLKSASLETRAPQLKLKLQELSWKLRYTLPLFRCDFSAHRYLLCLCVPRHWTVCLKISFTLRHRLENWGSKPKLPFVVTVGTREATGLVSPTSTWGYGSTHHNIAPCVDNLVDSFRMQGAEGHGLKRNPTPEPLCFAISRQTTASWKLKDKFSPLPWEVGQLSQRFSLIPSAWPTSLSLTNAKQKKELICNSANDTATDAWRSFDKETSLTWSWWHTCPNYERNSCFQMCCADRGLISVLSAENTQRLQMLVQLQLPDFNVLGATAELRNLLIMSSLCGIDVFPLT